MKHGSLFSGIGGAELAASWMGWENVFHCEINKYNQKLLKQHFPESISYVQTLKKTDFSLSHRGGIDILTGGFPCQPFSTAGKRLGTEDNRYLWKEMLRAIREISPRWIVGENVRGLTNWNGGMVFDQVQADMEAEDYEIIPFLFPACAVNAPHRRDRIWFIAYTGSSGTGTGTKGRNESRKLFQAGEREENKQFNKSFGESGIIANTSSKGLQKRIQPGVGSNENQAAAFKGRESARTFTADQWREFPTESPLCGGTNGLRAVMDRIKGIRVTHGYHKRLYRYSKQ